MTEQIEENKTRHRRRNRFSVDQIVGLRIVGKLLRYTREKSPHSSLRAWVGFLSKPIGAQKWNLSDIQRYETAGEFSQKGQNIKNIKPDYLVRVAPYTPYDDLFLTSITRGAWKRFEVDPLGSLILTKRQNLGKSFQHAIAAHRLDTTELLDDAVRGFLTPLWGPNTVSFKTKELASWLKVTPDMVLKSAIVQLADTVQAEMPDEDKEDCQTLEELFRSCLLENGYNLKTQSGVQVFAEKFDLNLASSRDKQFLDLLTSIFEGKQASESEVRDLQWVIYFLTGKRPISKFDS